MKLNLSRQLFSLLALVALLGLATPSANGQVLMNLYNFGTTSGDAAYPQSRLMVDSAGNLYGTNASGGAGSNGAVFELVNSNGQYTEQVLYHFSGSPDGANPSGGLVMDAAGNLYGTTYAGGSGYGTVFELVNNSGTYTESVLYSFSGSPDGANPESSLILDSAGNLYGTTNTGGSSNTGTVFELVNNGSGYTEQVLYSFTSGSDGRNPGFGALAMDAAGNLYGTTTYGGTYNQGVVYELLKASGYSEQVLHTFNAGNYSDGANPMGGVILDSAGNLYGTTESGGNGSYGPGIVFELVNNGSSYTEVILHSFNGTDGSEPFAGLTMDSAGNLWGTTLVNDGGTGHGTIFELVNNSGGYSYSGFAFANYCSALSYPYAGLVIDSTGKLYGSVGQGGTNGTGAIFSFTPSYSGPASTTSTVLASSANPANAGLSLTLTATVSSSLGYPQGMVYFSSGSVSLGYKQVDCSAAVLNVEDALTLGIGTSSITAQYTPTVSYFTSSQGTMSQSVTESGVVTTNGDNTLTGNQTINGNTTMNGNQTVSGTVTASSFIGDGSGLTNVTATVATASSLSCTGCVGTQQLGINYAASASQGGDALNALSLGGLPASFFATSSANIFNGDQSIFGGLSLNPSGTATASQAFHSNPLDLSASVYSSSVARAQSHRFRWMVEPAANSNNTTSPASTLNLLFDSNGTPAETGLSVNADGTINFAPGQSFPITELTTIQSGTGTVSALGAPNGIATLDSNGQIPASELPASNGTAAILTGWCSGNASSTVGASFAFAGLGAAVGTTGTTCANGAGAARVVGIPIASAGTLQNLSVYPGTLGNSGTHMTFTVYKTAAPGWSSAANETTLRAVSLAASSRTVTLAVTSAANFVIGNQISVSGISGTFNAGTNCSALQGSLFNGTYTVTSKTSTAISYVDANLPGNCGNIFGLHAAGTVADLTMPTLNKLVRTVPAATALTCTIAAPVDASAAVCSDTADSVAVNAGDIISVVATSGRTSGLETLGDIRVTLEKK